MVIIFKPSKIFECVWVTRVIIFIPSKYLSVYSNLSIISVLGLEGTGEVTMMTDRTSPTCVGDDCGGGRNVAGLLWVSVPLLVCACLSVEFLESVSPIAATVLTNLAAVSVKVRTNLRPACTQWKEKKGGLREHETLICCYEPEMRIGEQRLWVLTQA